MRKFEKSQWLGLGKESHGTVASASTPVKFFPFIADDEEPCDHCRALLPRERMIYVHSYENGSPIYLCPEHAALFDVDGEFRPPPH